MRNFSDDSGRIGCLMAIIVLLMPPLAVIHKGPKAFIITLLCTIFGFWVLGSVAAAIYLGD